MRSAFQYRDIERNVKAGDSVKLSSFISMHRSARRGVTGRDAAFDAVKGVLVLLMVVYHVMSITSTAGTGAFQYIRFISGSFIFVSGFIVSRFFAVPFGRDPYATSRKLLVRGLKVLLIFTVLNVLIHATGFGNLGKQRIGLEGLWSNAVTVYLTGDARMASFAILLPIAYLLIIAPAFLAIVQVARPRFVYGVLALALVVGAIPGLADRSMTVEFMLVGLCGMCAGSLPAVSALQERDSMSAMTITIGLLVSLWLTGRYGDNLALYCIGIAFILKFLHDGAKLIAAGRAAGPPAVLIGRYSLACYIGQIAAIQVLFRITGKHRWDVGFEVAAVCVATAMVIAGLCVGLEYLRVRSDMIDRSYRRIFL
jgi:hypothetical protein